MYNVWLCRACILKITVYVRLTLSVPRKPQIVQRFAILELARRLSYRAIQTIRGFSKSCSQNRKKTFFVFGGGISRGDVKKKACFGNFGHLCQPWAQPFHQLFWLKVLLETRSKYTSIEPWIDLLAYLQPKLWVKTQFLA